MRFDWWTLALQTINFVVLVWLLTRFLYKPVLGMIDARRAEVAQQYAGAAAAEAKAKALLEGTEKERAGIAAERSDALRAAVAAAEEAAKARRVQAEREAASLLDEARKTLATERDEASAAVREASLDLGTEIARRLLADLPTELRAEAWLERVEQHLANVTPAEREALNSSLNGGGNLHVVTALPLPEPVAVIWRTRLGRAFGAGTAVDFECDPALIAGTELHFPSAILRFSWRSVLETMRGEIGNHGNTR